MPEVLRSRNYLAKQQGEKMLARMSTFIHDEMSNTVQINGKKYAVVTAAFIFEK